MPDPLKVTFDGEPVVVEASFELVRDPGDPVEIPPFDYSFRLGKQTIVGEFKLTKPRDPTAAELQQQFYEYIFHQGYKPPIPRYDLSIEARSAQLSSSKRRDPLYEKPPFELRERLCWVWAVVSHPFRPDPWTISRVDLYGVRVVES